jgi:putative ABC transport system permease protein
MSGPPLIGLKLGWRLLRRDIASGEVRVLLAALVLAVCAVTSVGFVTDRAKRALDLEANRLLGGDAVLRSDQPVGEAPRALARSLGLDSTETLAFPSMVRVGDALKLSDIRALGAGYPLRGRFQLAQQPDARPEAASDIPARGTLWLTRAGAQALGARVGDTVHVGATALRLAALVVAEPDAALDYFNVAPRVFLNLDDLAATGLVQIGSRISHRFIVAGERDAVDAWVRRAGGALERGQRMETIADARPEIRSALERADRFLGLAALVSVVLAGIAVAMAARRHAQHHLDGCAVMRCLGAPQRTILAIHGGELVWVGLASVLVGVLLGWLIQWLIGHSLARMLGMAIPPAGWMPALEGLAVGFSVLVAFALPPLLALRRVPAVRVLRRDIGGFETSAVVSAVAGIGGLAALLWWKAGSATLGAVVLGGIAATLAVLAVLAFGLVLLVRRLRRRLRGPWRYGLANVGRRARASVVQVSALGLGLMAILLLTLVRTDLIGRWQDSLPPDAPNRFLINIQPDQVDAVRERLLAGGVADPELVPMVRARLRARNGEPLTGGTYADRSERAQRLAEREFNLSWAESLRERDNTVTGGRFWAAEHRGEPEFSVEENLAATLGWRIGDRIEFDLAGTALVGRISNVRRVDWESFRPNFFVLVTPGALAGIPASHIGAIHVPPGSGALTDDLVREFPNLSVIDIEAVLAQVRATADQVAGAVEYVFYFTLLAGVLVLLAAVSATQDERLLEGGVMRAFGASRRQLRLAHLSEFAVIGLLAGLTAAVAATLVSGAIAREVFDLPWRADWRLAAVGGVIGVLAVSVAGLWATRRVVSAPPSVTLRALQA